MFKHFLLCTHGTPGARMAETFFFTTVWTGFPESKATVLTVVNQDWSLMVGDDWLNSSSTRNAFRNHVDQQLAEEIEEDWQRIQNTYPLATRCSYKRLFGPIEQTLVEAANNYSCDCIIIGPYQRKQGKGLKSRLQNKVLHPLLTVPLLVAPWVTNG